MKVGIVGSRYYNDYKSFVTEIENIFFENNWAPTEIVSGGAMGVDRMAWQYALVKKIKYKEFPADWKAYGKIAGPMRNTQIIDYADVIITFWDYSSTGTRDSIEKAKTSGKKLIVIDIRTLGKKA